MGSNPYPKKVCKECGERSSKDVVDDSAEWVKGKCDHCGYFDEVTSPSNFFYPSFRNCRPYKPMGDGLE